MMRSCHAAGCGRAARWLRASVTVLVVLCRSVARAAAACYGPRLVSSVTLVIRWPRRRCVVLVSWSCSNMDGGALVEYGICAMMPMHHTPIAYWCWTAR